MTGTLIMMNQKKSLSAYIIGQHRQFNTSSRNHAYVTLGMAARAPMTVNLQSVILPKHQKREKMPHK